MINGRGLFLLVALALLATCVRARSADLPPGITCEQIRELVAQHGKARAIAWAIEHGYSLAMINEARKCLRASP